MTRRSLVESRRGFFTFIMSFLIPIPFVVFSVLDFTKDRNGREGNITIAVFMSFCYLTTSVAYFKVFRIIRQHQIQVQGNQSSQNFGQPAINLAKYKKSVVLILYILALFSLCFLPMIVSLVCAGSLGNYSRNMGGILQYRWCCCFYLPLSTLAFMFGGWMTFVMESNSYSARTVRWEGVQVHLDLHLSQVGLFPFCIQYTMYDKGLIASLAQNSPPSRVCTKLFSSSGTLHVDILFIFAALGFCSW